MFDGHTHTHSGNKIHVKFKLFKKNSTSRITWLNRKHQIHWVIFYSALQTSTQHIKHYKLNTLRLLNHMHAKSCTHSKRSVPHTHTWTWTLCFRDHRKKHTRIKQGQNKQKSLCLLKPRLIDTHTHIQSDVETYHTHLQESGPRITHRCEKI